MLYDKRWDKTKVDPFSLESLVAWLEKMPARKAYDYMGCEGKCLLEQYFASKGFKNVEVGGSYCRLDDNCIRDLPEAFADLAVEKPRIFGAALTRAKAALAAQS